MHPSTAAPRRVGVDWPAQGPKGKNARVFVLKGGLVGAGKPVHIGAEVSVPGWHPPSNCASTLESQVVRHDG